ncbi:ABC transporter permease [uncultured Desulfovibrio sp.]|uniref:ABC transporter permease n=1 Tax=uncultured Desulfovibrio sp. TaxID=167968 RepID=UPI002637F2E9|nr:ABC transporter permease [uncultured Desulfovibrio sp.]
MSDLFRVSLRQVVRQGGFGVILSIALGITAFVALSVLGREIRYKVGQDMVLMGGVNVIRIYMDDQQYPGQPQREFYPETVDALRALPGVGMVSRNLRGGRMFTLRGEGERSMSVDFIGVDQYFAEVYSLTLVAGRLFNADDMGRHRRVCMLGREAARNLYGDPADALGKLLFLEKDVVEVVGVLSGVMLGSWGQGGFLPYTTMMDRNWAGGKVTRLFIRAIGWEDVPPLVRMIPEVVREHQSAPYLVVRTQEEQLERIKTTFMWVEALLWLGIAASLMLGGFGIWHGTFAAVRARTREVGLKKAMGGSDADILAQFLAEALCKSVAGGILGIVVGVVLVEVGAWSLGTGISYPLLIASSLGSIVFSALIGVAGGLYPALQASRMDVVSALRFE